MEGYLWDRPTAKDAFKLAAKIARKAGRMTSITLSDSFCVDRHRDSFLDLIRNDIDIVFANETEIKSLYQTQNFDGALQAIRARLPDCRADAFGGGLRVVARGEEIHVGTGLSGQQGGRCDRRRRSLRRRLSLRLHAGQCRCRTARSSARSPPPR